SEFMARASNEIFQPRVKPINIAHLKETAITSYDHVVQMIKDGQLGALNVLHGIEGKVARIGSFDGLPFTQQNLIALQRGALLNAINHNYYQACKGWEDDRGNVAALHTLLHRLDAFAELNDGALPSKAHGLRFDESDLMPMVRDMNTWRQPSSPAYRAALGLH
ncbi:MAG TPA: hypothetical protein VHB73_05375, partial [Alphaproteobacteria bacterium]|nr:hypothetical protein [Alphaproteobacteria bacterium]